uniref:BBSome-interacting protein 1 n=1 Tax=Culex pipiens TaxID=7175 RepID=A0A8D8DM30_CULPI
MSLTPAAENATTNAEEQQLLHQIQHQQKRASVQHHSHNLQQQQQQQPITLILPTSGKLFYEKKQDFALCKPQLLPLKSFSLEKLEKMQKEAHRQLQENRARTAAAAAENF